MSSPKSGVILFTGIPFSGKSSLAEALQEVLIANGLKPVVLEKDGFPLLDPKSEPAWTRAVLTAAGLLAREGYMVLIPVQLNDERAVEEARQKFAWFKEIFLKCSPEEAIRRGHIAGPEEFTKKVSVLRSPGLGELAVDSGRQSFEACLKQILDWLTRQNVISERPKEKNEPVGAGAASKDVELIREKLKSLGYL